MNIYVPLFFYTVNNGLAVICQLSLKHCVHIMTQGTNGCITLPAVLPSVSESVQINKLNTHCIKDKGWTEILPSSLRTLWKLRENVCIASEESWKRWVRQETLRRRSTPCSGVPYRVTVPHQCRRRWGAPGDVAEALVPSVHPTAYSALQAYPGLQSCILVSATLVYGYGQVDNHLKA